MTRPLRIAHLADTHLGYRALGRIDPASGRNQRAVDAEHAFGAAIDDILARDVDLVLHAGDAFHHTRPSWETVGQFVRQLRRIEAAGLPCLVIAGNHDTPRLRTTGSMYDVLAEFLPGIRFVAGYQEEEVAFDDLDLAVQAIPHGALTNPDPPAPLLRRGRWNVLVTHGLAPGVQLRGQHEPGETHLSGTVLDPDFDYIALGHFHLWGDQGRNAWYAGGTERFGWGDFEATPGYNLVTLPKRGALPEVEHVPVPSRPMVRLKPVPGGGLSGRAIADRIADALAEVSDPASMVRVEVRDAARPVRREAEALLRDEVGDRVWHLQVVSPGDVFLAGGELDGETSLDVRSLFNLFLDDRVERNVYDEPFALAFRQRGGRALDEAVAREREAEAEGAA